MKKTINLARTNTAFNPEVPHKPRDRKRKRCPEGEAVNSVEVTQCPHYVDRRFEPEVGFIGELTLEWNRLRAHPVESPSIHAAA